MSHLPIPKQLSHWLTNTTTQLGQYQVKVNRLLSLNRLWKQQQHIPLCLHSTIANVGDKVMVLAVESSAWASELHYAQQSLRRLFNSWPHLAVDKIKWYVTATEPNPLECVPPSKTIELSEANKALLQSVARTIPHTELMRALFKLAQH